MTPTITDEQVAAVSVPTNIEVLTEGGYKEHSTAQPSMATARLESPNQALIRLDPQEERLFQLIVATTDAYARGDITLPPTTEDDGTKSPSTVATIAPTPRLLPNGKPQPPTIRVAGGWVRDKLLGLVTHDVDLAVDDLTGVQFANLIQAYLQHTNQQQQVMGHHRIGVIAANPAQSKHLETATIILYNMDIDISNLRAQEIYQEDSRIPTVRFGTPLEDSERRDFTVNALFFNLHTRQVEDWTRRGMLDLHHGRLVTPLEPIQTFHDDPLRVLRAIRFGVRYQLEFHPDLITACQRTDIHQALHRKVSRERVGKELEGMLSGTGAKPIQALNTIADLFLAGSVFALPVIGTDSVSAIEGHILGKPYHDLDFDSEEAREIRQVGWTEAQAVIQILPNVLASHSAAVASDSLSNTPTSSTGIDHRLLPVGVFLSPFRNLRYQEKKKTDKSYNVAQYIFQHGIKFKTSDVRAMTLLQDEVEQMVKFLKDSAQDPSSVSRLEAGLILRTMKDLWRTGLLLATVLLIREEGQTTNDQTAATEKWTNVCNQLYLTILEMGLDSCWRIRPLLDGKAVIKALDIPRGPTVGQYLEEQMRWMLSNPQGSKEECEEHLQTFKRRLENPPSDVKGRSDGKGEAIPLLSDQKQNTEQHFNKKVHVESTNS